MPLLPSCPPVGHSPWGSQSDPVKMVIKSGPSPAHQNRSSLQDVKVHISRFYGLLRFPLLYVLHALDILVHFLFLKYAKLSLRQSPHLCHRESCDCPSIIQVNPNITSSESLSPATLPTVFTHPSATPSPNSISLSPKQVSLLDIKQGNNFKL